MRQALISVSRKEVVFPLAKTFIEHGIQIIASDGTATALQSAGIQAVSTSQYLNSKPILGGRVKTLHPHLFGGILADQNDPAHQLDLDAHQIKAIDFVVVDLYPFEQHMHDVASAVENIDIGGVSLIRAAAKNYNTCSVICCEDDYDKLIYELRMNQGYTSEVFRQQMAAYAFHEISVYDQQISTWFAEKIGSKQQVSKEFIKLSYGENPHQEAEFYLPTDISPMMTALQGSALSYNNILDLDAGIKLAADIKNKAATVIKHTNPCGVAQGETAKEAILQAFNADLKSAYGGVVVLNTRIDEHVAAFLKPHFIEVLAAPAFTSAALDILAKKEKLRVIQYSLSLPNKEIKSALNGVLIQERNQHRATISGCSVPTQLKPKANDWPALLFAMTVAKHLKSNAIAIVKDNMSIGLSSGQTNRVDAVEAAIHRAKNHDLKSAVLASDGFFPFIDNIGLIAESGIKYIIQPGGSIRDEEIIAYCDQFGVCMVMAGVRQFKH